MAILYKPTKMTTEKVALNNGIRFSYKDLQDKVGGSFQINQCSWSQTWQMVTNIKSMKERKDFNKMATMVYNADFYFKKKPNITKLYGTCMLVRKRELDASLNYV